MTAKAPGPYTAAMATLTIRDLSKETLEAFRVRAARHGRSMEAEARELIRAAVGGFPATAQLPAEERIRRAQSRVRDMFGGEVPKGLVDSYLAERRAAAERDE